jgi:hypothetical protein
VVHRGKDGKAIGAAQVVALVSSGKSSPAQYRASRPQCKGRRRRAGALVCVLGVWAVSR